MESSEGILEIEREIILDEDNPLKRANTKTREVPVANDLENYIFLCSQSLALVSTSIDKARLAIKLLETSYKSAPKNIETSADEFIEFAIENYFIRSAAIYDRCMIFINRLLDLGISNESICHELLVTNDHAIKYGLKEKLKSVRKKCTEYRIERNKIVHHSRYSEEVFDQVAAMHKINSFQKRLGEEPIYTKKIIDKLTHEIINIKSEEFSAHLESIVVKVHDLYDAALPIYRKKKNVHRSKL